MKSQKALIYTLTLLLVSALSISVWVLCSNISAAKKVPDTISVGIINYKILDLDCFLVWQVTNHSEHEVRFDANRIATDITVNSRSYVAASDPVILQPGETYNFQLFIPARYLQGIFEYYHVSLTAITENGTKATYKKSIPISV